ncbi:MAG TPA: nucleotide exchange factor GrpE [Nitrososphaeraceae archaeon]|nr:nucleotide exchange factor GrpE [Nitrososphaeraceae archaeon]HEX2230897.1 nucleotide exchange factor GrpE [Nitrososphaeraceae archaeon]
MEEESNEIKEVETKESRIDNDDNNITNLKEDLSALKEELREARKSSDNNLNRLKYMMAEFDNYRKQMEKQIDSRIESGKAELLVKFLSLRDDYLRALEMAKQSKSETVVIEGLEGILKNFDSLLRSEGVMEIETIGTPFDPNVHDAIGFSHQDEIEENIITKEIRKGYMLNNKVLRPSLVLISRKIVKNTANDTEKIEKEAEN